MSQLDYYIILDRIRQEVFEFFENFSLHLYTKVPPGHFLNGRLQIPSDSWRVKTKSTHKGCHTFILHYARPKYFVRI